VSGGRSLLLNRASRGVLDIPDVGAGVLLKEANPSVPISHRGGGTIRGHFLSLALTYIRQMVPWRGVDWGSRTGCSARRKGG